MNIITHNKIIVYVLASIMISTCNIATAQQRGTLEGIIKNSEDGLGIPSVNIVIEGTMLGSTTGLHGNFSISGIPTGKYMVIISYIGFRTREEVIVISPDSKTTLDISLEPASLSLSSVQIQARKPFSTASARCIREFDIKLRPAKTSQDLLTLAPGLIIAQHAGGGKAEQIFMRGFDADHGTDVAISVDGLPVNMVTHGHGQGYADLHFLIPEIVESLDVYKGPYFSQFGDFATAGAVTFKTTDHPEDNMIKVEGGMFNTGEITTVLKIPTSDSHRSAYLAAKYGTTDGPFESPQGFNRFNVFGKFHTHISKNSELAVSMGGFSSAWDASGQIPTRAVEQGLITRFGAIDDMEGGTTSRTYFSVLYENGAGTNSTFSLQAYSSWYDFKLFSNFTFFLVDSINGDMIEQTDSRFISGINSKYVVRSSIGNTVTKSTIGAGLRADNINVELWKSPDRVREYANRIDQVNQRNLFLWFDEVFYFNTKWRLQLGLRADYFTFNMNDKIENSVDTNSLLPHASTYSQKLLVNPKLNLVYSPGKSVEIFLNAGSGFHSNDARDIIIAQRINEIEHALSRKGYTENQIDSVLISRFMDPLSADISTLPVAIGTELGTKITIGENVIFGLTGWYLHMEEELVFIGDEGTTEISGKTQRIGIDFEARIQLLKWLWADLDLNLSKGKYLDEPAGSNHIPLAPGISSTGGLSALHPSGIEGTLRYRYIGSRPANEDNTVRALGYTLLNANIGYRFGKFKVYANVENITNTDWNEAQFDTESMLKGEINPVSEINFTPGNPINVKFGAIMYF